MPLYLPPQIYDEIYKQGSKPRIGIEVDYWAKNYATHGSFVVQILDITSASNATASTTGITDTDIDFDTLNVKVGDYLVISDATPADSEGAYQITAIDGNDLDVSGWDSGWSTDVINDYTIERRYDGIVSGQLSIDSSVNIEDGIETIKQANFGILNQEFTSIDFQDGVDPENSNFYVYLYFNDGSTILIDERFEMFSGKISEFPDISEELLSFAADGNDPEMTLLMPTGLIEASDVKLQSGSTLGGGYNLNAIGEVKPVVYGDHPFYYGLAGGNIVLTKSEKHDMLPLIYMGYYNSGGYDFFYAASHQLKTKNTDYYNVWIYNGRWTKIMDTSVTPYGATYSMIAIDPSPDLQTFFYPNGEVTNEDTSGSGSSLTNNDACVDGDTSTPTTMVITDAAATSYVEFDIEFPDPGFTLPATNVMRMEAILEFERDSAEFTLTATLAGESPTTILPTTGVEQVRLEQIINSTDLTRSMTIRLEQTSGLALGDSATVNIYYVVNTIEYNDALDYLSDQVYLACQGAYDDGSGTYTGSASALIQKPTDVMYHIMKYFAGITSFNTDSITAARALLTSWKFDFILNTQRTFRELIKALGSESSSVWFKNQGTWYTKAYNASAPFTFNNMVFNDSRLVADSNILDSATDFEIEVYFKSPDEIIINNSPSIISHNNYYDRIYMNGLNYLTFDFWNGSVYVPVNVVYSFSLSTNYKIIIIKSGTNLYTNINGTEKNTTTSGANSLRLNQYGARRSFDSQKNFNSELYYAKIWSGGDRNTGTLVLDLEGINEEPVDQTGNFTFTEFVSGAGTLTYPLSNKGIFDYSPITASSKWDELPISESSLSIRKKTDPFFTKMILNYFKGQSTLTDIDTTYHSETVTETRTSEFINDATTAQYLIDFLFAVRARKRFECIYSTWLQGARLQFWDIINIRHDLLASIFTESTMNSKKWIVTGVRPLSEDMSYKITAEEL